MTMLEDLEPGVEPEVAQRGSGAAAGVGHGTRRRRRRLWVAAGTLAALVIAGVIAFTIFEPIQVLPRIRLAPGFALTDQAGATVTSEDLRGSVVLYTFTYSNCEEPCDAPEPTMAEIAERIGEVDLGETDMRFVTLSFDPSRDDRVALAARAERFGADGETWKYATASTDQIRNVIGSGFKTWFEDRGDGTFSFDPALVLVDGWGIIRGEYRYQTLADDADRILRHIGILGDELRNSRGANSLAYEAAHFFLCYP
jgi:protein SCO1/2